MTQDEQRRALARARERADLARMRFGNAVNAALDRISPDRLKQDAIEIATDQIEDTWHAFIKRFPYWPLAAATLGAGIAAIFIWRPARIAVRHAARGVELAWAVRQLWSQSNERGKGRG